MTMAEDDSLLAFMELEGLFPSIEDEHNRNRVVLKLGEIISIWVQNIAWQRNLPAEDFSAASATILTFGSYELGVHDKESNIDVVCIGPYFATRNEDFFVVLYSILKNIRGISEIYCIKDVKVPLLRFRFCGNEVDLPYAQLRVTSVPSTADALLDFSHMKDVDKTSLKSLSGVRSNNFILKLVPNLEVFRLLVRCVKLWARRRGIYGHVFGFLGGIHLAIQSAYVCQRNPKAALVVLVSKFFETFALWKWPTPLLLEDALSPRIEDAVDGEAFMPIGLPVSPPEWCRSNITISTFDKIKAEFLQSHVAMQHLSERKFRWNDMFQPFPYKKTYTRFLKIYLSATSEDVLRGWVGWVTSRFRLLILKLEQLQGQCDPSPAEYTDAGIEEPHVVFYWGLQLGRNSRLDLQSLEEDFSTSLRRYRGSVGSFKLFQASEIP